MKRNLIFGGSGITLQSKEVKNGTKYELTYRAEFTKEQVETFKKICSYFQDGDRVINLGILYIFDKAVEYMEEHPDESGEAELDNLDLDYTYLFL